MKYIRTKDELGVYVEYDGEYKDLNKGTYFKTWRGVYIHEDWKVADTIEELCDEFVYVDEEIKQFLVSDDIDKYKAKQYKVFGAIWTNKGLIYVAKMNDKGEFELL